MIRALRKKHRIIWYLIPVLTVPIVVISIVHRPVFMKTENALVTEIQAMGEILKEYENADLKVNLRGRENLLNQLEIILKIPLKSPFCVVHAYYKNGQQMALGTIGQRGIYRFSIENNEPISELIFKDEIKQEEVTRLKLN